MTINTLNKIIALFLTGGAALFFIGVLHWQQLSKLLPPAGGEPSAGAWVLVGLIAFPLAALVGAIAEGVSEVTIQELVKRSESSRAVAAFFLRPRAKKHLDDWKSRLVAVSGPNRSFDWVEKVGSQDQRWRLHSTVGGMFLYRSSPDLFRWLVQHYSTYVLAANMAFVLAATILYVVFASIASGFGWWWPVLLPAGIPQTILMFLAAGCALWALMSHAVGRYLYSHELSTRHVALWIVDHRDERMGGDGQ